MWIHSGLKLISVLCKFNNKKNVHFNASAGIIDSNPPAKWKIKYLKQFSDGFFLPLQRFAITEEWMGKRNVKHECIIMQIIQYLNGN